MDRDDELAEAIDELTATLRTLREELEPRRRSRLRPPTPDELLRFSDEVALPALVAILEANLRALEAFQRGLQLFRREREIRDGADRAVESTRTQATELRRTTLDQLDGALTELQRAAGDGTLPRDRRARELIEQARDLREEVDRRLREAGADVETAEPTGKRIEIDDGIDDETTDDPGADVDVDAELETLRDRYADESDDEHDAPGGGGDDENGDNGDDDS
ncbi:DUF7547 family protein [Natrialbaceae archaeon AArc-T1-2]|uniref:DUF7547 family protein n=1 Tax=Natrialbaceae archaeon AArc-T1-2 TaxID=3053904 RepID=UPI00255AE441|nr:hypothetical protein [Natrialbaceae archaeon AArc-T1-2]WIV67284.1 hypothetical protein QQ977_00745 [Natrialbaceae archaeon AArc-T1-2]